jgi:hypothetical protein
MLKGKFGEVENKISRRTCGKLRCDSIMITRSLVSRICLIQSLLAGCIG